MSTSAATSNKIATSKPHDNRKRSADVVAVATAGGGVDAQVPSPPKALKVAPTRFQQQATAFTSTADKGYKGLRHFSMMVCKKVEQKGTTTYNEVADELVKTVMEERRRASPRSIDDAKKSSESATTAAGTAATANRRNSDSSEKSASGASELDEKNIRRRVYDALNVLMAMDIIVKHKKEISWKGLPSSAGHDMEALQRELWYRERAVAKKRETLQELLIQHVCFRNLVQLNLGRSLKKPAGKENSKGLEHTKDNVIPLPFIVINTSSQAVIQCHMSRDMTDVMFDFSKPFEINDDNTILKRLGLHRTTSYVIRSMIPNDIYHYCMQHNLLDSILNDDDTSTSTSGAGVTGFAGDAASAAAAAAHAPSQGALY